MLPSILSSRVRESTRRFLVTAYEPSDTFFGGVVQRFVEGLDGVGKGPYLQAGLPFRMGVEEADFFAGFTLPNPVDACISTCSVPCKMHRRYTFALLRPSLGC